MKNRFNQIVLTAMFMAGVSGASLAGLPLYYPENMPYSGLVGEVNNNSISVNAIKYRLDPNLRVHTLTTQYGTRGALQPGTPVGFTTTTDRAGNSRINEIWVLPDVELD